MDIQVKLLDGVQFSAGTRGHTIICDQPLESGGADGGMTPPELLLASLGTCAAYYAVQYLKFQRIPSEGLAVRVEADKAKDPPRLGAFRIFVDHPAAAEDKHREGLRRAVEKCLIHHTLLHAPSIEIAVAAPALALKLAL